MDNFEIASSARLIQARFSKISAVRLSAIAKGGAFDVEASISIKPSEKESKKAIAKLQFSINGFPDDGDNKKNPDFSVDIEVRGVFEWSKEVDPANFNNKELTSILMLPLYQKAVVMAETLVHGVGIPGIRFDQDFRLATQQSEEEIREPLSKKTKPKTSTRKSR